MKKMPQQLEALVEYLKANLAKGLDISEIEVRHTHADIHTYVYASSTYYVALCEMDLDTDTHVELNGLRWSILKERTNSPYARFTDGKVIKALQSISPEGYTIKSINQKDHEITYQQPEGETITFSYAAHYPNRIDSYYLRGSK